MTARRMKSDEKEVEDKSFSTKTSEKLSAALSSIASRFPRRSKPVVPEHTKETLSLEDLIGVGRKTSRQTTGDVERLKKETVVQKRAEMLYRIDPLIFSGVNRLVRLISSKILFVGGEDKDRNEMESWARSVGLKKVLKEAVQDVFIYGYSIIEKVRNKEGLVVRLITVDPKTVDWLKDGTKLKVDKFGDPVGFEQKVTGEDPVTLEKDDVILLRFFALGRECLGITPIEPAFKASWIRLNLEEAYGEAIYRHGYPLYYFLIGNEQHDLSAEDLTEAKRVLRSFDSAQELILPYWIKPDRLDPKADVKAVVDLWVFLAGEIARALDSPLGYITPTGGGREGKGTVEYANLDLEKAVKTYQEDLKEQLDEQLLSEVRVAKKLNSIPELVFTEESPQNQMLRMRMISMLSARGALHIDVKTENRLRQELELPTVSEEADTSCVFGLTEQCPIKVKKTKIEKLSDFCRVCPNLQKEKDKEKLSKEELTCQKKENIRPSSEKVKIR